MTPSGGRAHAVALLALLLLLPAVATPATADVRQEDLEGAQTESTIFPAILSRTVRSTTDLLEASPGLQEPHAAPEDQRADLGNLLTSFDERLVDAIRTRGTPPPRLTALQSDYETTADAIEQVLTAQQQLATNVTRLREEPRGPEAAGNLENGLAAITLERGGLSALSAAAGNLTTYGVEPDPLREAIDARRDRLADLEQRLKEQLARLRLPGLLLLETQTRTVELGRSLTLTGLALNGGEPATQAQINVSLGPIQDSVGVGPEGRFTLSMPVPLSLGAGEYDATAEAYINGTTREAGPIPITVEPLEPSLSLTPVTTVLQERTPLRVNGTLSIPSFEEENRTVTLELSGMPVANLTTGENGTYTGFMPVPSNRGGDETLQAVYEPDEPQLASVSTTPISIFIPRTQEQLQLAQEQADVTFTPFDVPSTGLGPVVDILAGLTLLGLAVLVVHSLTTARGGVSVLSLGDLTLFDRMTTFRPAPEEAKREADPRNAFPPPGPGDRWAPGPLFEAFVDGLREFEDLPPGVTHRELARHLVREGMDRDRVSRAVMLFERARYSREADGYGVRERRQLYRELSDTWRTYVDRNVDEPPRGRWWPKAPTFTDGQGW